MTTSAKFQILKANATDEEQLNLLYSEKSRDGSLQINLERSPDFFEALRVEGYDSVVNYVKDTQTGHIAGAGIRTIRECYINGEIKKIGYLSGLRVAEKYRKSRVMAMIFQKLKHMYLQGECTGYLFSVFNNNTKALHALTSGKAGLPMVKTVGNYNSFIFKPKLIASKNFSGPTIRQATIDDIGNLISFLNEEGRKRQYCPHYTSSDFSSTGSLKNMNMDDVILALDNNEIIGCLALWDQTPFRRWKVGGYSRMLKICRPILNGIFKILDLPQYPKANTLFNYRILSLVCIKNNNTDIFSSLFNQLMRNIGKSDDVLISASFFDTDPLIRVLPKLKICLKSTIFIGHWSKTQSEIDAMDDRFPYLEAGSL